jgi:hypothetical protein
VFEYKRATSSAVIAREGGRSSIPETPDGIEQLCTVIARSEARKQSILSLCGKMDCFALLAMTVGPFEN